MRSKVGSEKPAEAWATYYGGTIMQSTSPNISPNNKMRCTRDTDTAHSNDGGATGTRTPDPLLAKQMLSQLSYRPIRMQNAKGRMQKVKDFCLLHFAFCISSGGRGWTRTTDLHLIRMAL